MLHSHLSAAPYEQVMHWFTRRSEHGSFVFAELSADNDGNKGSNSKSAVDFAPLRGHLQPLLEGLLRAVQPSSHTRNQERSEAGEAVLGKFFCRLLEREREFCCLSL